MDFSFDLKNHTDGPRAMESRSVCGHPDWHALQARLIASRELNGARNNDLTTNPDATRGSFAPAAARILAPSSAAPAGVNPNDLANRKPDPGMMGIGVGAQSPAGEG